MNQLELIEVHKKLSAEASDTWGDLRETYDSVLSGLARLIESHGPTEEYYAWQEALVPTEPQPAA